MLETEFTPSQPIQLAVKRMAEFFRVLSNPRRILIVEELQGRELDVSSISSALELDQAAVSKHLAVLRAYRLVIERKEGRSVFYRLSDPEITSWIVEGLKFTEPNLEDAELLLLGLKQAKMAWKQARDEGLGK